MLKWAVPNQRRDLCLDALETLSNHSSSSDSSSCHITDLTIPIRYHDRACRPKSLAFSPSFNLESELNQMNKLKVTGGSPPSNKKTLNKVVSSPVYSGCSKAQTASNNKRHSMFVGNGHSFSHSTNKDQEPTKISTRRRHGSMKLPSETSTDLINEEQTNTTTPTNDNGVLKISTTTTPKDKSRNTFWKNLRAKAQGKSKDGARKLSKSHSLSNIPNSEKESVRSNSESSEDSGLSPDIKQDEDKHTTGKSSGINRRRSFKFIQRKIENKMPKPFSKQSFDFDSIPTTNGNISPDSGISNIRISRSSDDADNVSPGSPITPIDVAPPANLTHLRQQFTDAVLQYLNERKCQDKGNSVSSSIRSNTSASEISEDGASDIFSYDMDTVLRRPNTVATTAM